MSLTTQQYVWDNSKQKGSARLVMLSIADNANDYGDAFPGISRIAKRCAMSESNVKLAIQQCERDGELLVYENCGMETGNGKTNLYRIVMPGVEQRAPLDAEGKPIAPRAIKPKKERKFREGDQPVNPLGNDGGQLVNPPDGQPVNPLGDQPVNPKRLVNGQGTVSKARRRVHSTKQNKWLEQDALIDIWTKEVDRFGTHYFGWNRSAATELMSMEITPKEIQETIKWRRPNGGLDTYEFTYLVQDVPAYRLHKAQLEKEAARKAAAQAKIDAFRRANRADLDLIAEEVKNAS